MVFGGLGRNSQAESIYLGSPEAEADANPSARVPLHAVYEDYHGLIQQLSYEKFIVVGRKGSGKSAFAEYVWQESQHQANLFCQFVRKSDFSIETIVQIGCGEGVEIDSEALFRWIIYTKLLKLFAFNESVQDDKNYELLRQFLKKNSGYIDIRDFEIKELIRKHGFDVNVEQFRRFFRLRYGRDIEVKSSRASFYKLLPHLEEVIISVLSTRHEKENRNSYVLFFDDLDVGFSVEDKVSCDSLVSLIRACRHVNNEIFGKNGITAKAIILIRDDIESFLSGRYADTAKIFASYATKINWYQDEHGRPLEEHNLNIKKFINKRIRYAFSQALLEVDENDPWSGLVQENGEQRSMFKWMLNNTLFRPRDLLLIFKPLENGGYSFPLGNGDVKKLVSTYSEELAKELKNELSSFYGTVQIETIFNALGALSRDYKTYDESAEVFSHYCEGVDSHELLEYLFDRSVIGNLDENGWFTFKCREPLSSPEPYKLKKDQKIAVQYGIRAYVVHKGYR